MPVPSQSPRTAWLATAAAIATALFAAGLVALLRLCALKAAGIQVVAPTGGGALQSVVRLLEGNLDWLVVTVVGLALTAVVALMMFGSQRAPDHLFRIGAAIALLIVGIPAVLK